jgi:hypothetical protein
MPKKKSLVVDGHARMWPRAVFEKFDFGHRRTKGTLAREIDFLDRAGVYILYRDDEPHYIGQAERLGKRLWAHARQTNGPYYHFWNFFSAFAIADKTHRDEIEGILIASMPTANGAKPRLKRQAIPREVCMLLREMYGRARG